MELPKGKQKYSKKVYVFQGSFIKQSSKNIKDIDNICEYKNK